MGTESTTHTDPILVVGVLWEDHIGLDWQITVQGAESDEAALQACQDRSRIITDENEVLYLTDWKVVEHFEHPPFSRNYALHL